MAPDTPGPRLTLYAVFGAAAAAFGLVFAATTTGAVGALAAGVAGVGVVVGLSALLGLFARRGRDRTR